MLDSNSVCALQLSRTHLLIKTGRLLELKMELKTVDAQESWLTPAEVFQPYFGQALARYIQQQAKSHQSAVHINELGGGTGTLARNILVMPTCSPVSLQVWLSLTLAITWDC